MENSEVVIKVKDLTKSFKVGNQYIPVIKGMSFEVFKSDFTVIIGASGSGKSTLLHMLLGLEVPTSGMVTCLNTDLYQLANEDARSSFRKKHIGMVYQQPNWIKSLNVVENVAFPLSLLGMDSAEALKQAWKVILRMNMSNWVNYFPTELSGGQQQKIALARALVTDPEILIADEPTGNLDFESGQILMNLLQELNESGKTILMVTHDLEYIKYAKSVIKIFDGKVESIIDNSTHPEDSNDELIKGIHMKKSSIDDKKSVAKELVIDKKSKNSKPKENHPKGSTKVKNVKQKRKVQPKKNINKFRQSKKKDEIK